MLTAEELYPRWREAKAGAIDQNDLREPGPGFEHLQNHPNGTWHVCPCGGEDHAAYRPLETFYRIDEHGCRVPASRSPAQVLTCFETGQQWLIRVDVAGTIRREEERFLDLLNRAPRIVAKVIRKMGRTDAAFAFLKDTHGIDRDAAELILETP
jgi:hypothetical protein